MAHRLKKSTQNKGKLNSVGGIPIINGPPGSFARCMGSYLNKLLEQRTKNEASRTKNKERSFLVLLQFAVVKLTRHPGTSFVVAFCSFFVQEAYYLSGQGTALECFRSTRISRRKFHLLNFALANVPVAPFALRFLVIISQVTFLINYP